MKNLYKVLWLYVIITISALVLRGTGHLDSVGYESILKWLNFGTLAFLIINFGRIPIKNFLLSQQQELAEEIDEIEQKKENLKKDLLKAQEALKEGHERFSEMKEHIIQQGEKKKAQIIADANEKSARMLEDTRQRIERMTNQAKISLASEMIDAAIEMARNRLSEIVTDEDHQKYIDRYMSQISRQ